MHATRDDLRGQGCLSIRHGKGPISRLEFGCIRDGGNAFDKGTSALFQPGLRADSRQRANPTTPARKAMCHTETAPGADESFSKTPDEGEPVTPAVAAAPA